jgi:hypothetical protein
MANFIVTFRIKADDDYQSRYDSFVAKAHELAGSPGSTWEETSSFLAFDAPGTAEEVCQKLYFGSDFNASKDVMLVIDLTRRQKASQGNIRYPNMLEACLGF